MASAAWPCARPAKYPLNLPAISRISLQLCVQCFLYPRVQQSTTWTAKTDANRAVGQVNLADSTSNEWYVTGVQLEAGDTASEFEFLPVEVNLARFKATSL